MTEQMDLELGEALKKRGMELAAIKRHDALKRARVIAERLALIQTTVSADDVIEALEAEGTPASDLGNAAGSIFKGRKWDFWGWQKSRRRSNHARIIMKWRLLP